MSTPRPFMVWLLFLAACNLATRCLTIRVVADVQACDVKVSNSLCKHNPSAVLCNPCDSNSYIVCDEDGSAVFEQCDKGQVYNPATAQCVDSGLSAQSCQDVMASMLPTIANSHIDDPAAEYYWVGARNSKSSRLGGKLLSWVGSLFGQRVPQLSVKVTHVVHQQDLGTSESSMTVEQLGGFSNNPTPFSADILDTLSSSLHLRGGSQPQQQDQHQTEQQQQQQLLADALSMTGLSSREWAELKNTDQVPQDVAQGIATTTTTTTTATPTTAEAATQTNAIPSMDVRQIDTDSGLDQLLDLVSSSSPIQFDTSSHEYSGPFQQSLEAFQPASTQTIDTAGSTAMDSISRDSIREGDSNESQDDLPSIMMDDCSYDGTDDCVPRVLDMNDAEGIDTDELEAGYKGAMQGGPTKEAEVKEALQSTSEQLGAVGDSSITKPSQVLRLGRGST